MQNKTTKRKKALELREGHAEKYEKQLESIVERLKSETDKRVISQLKEKREVKARKLSIARQEIETLKERIGYG